LVRSSKKSNKAVEKVVSFVQKNGGIDYSTQKMLDFRDKALQVLALYPESEYRLSLEKLTDYIVERSK
jgi:octaprenyl-diphosphate synthase